MLSASASQFGILAQGFSVDRKRHEALTRFFNEQYWHFASQRSEIIDQLKGSLSNNCEPYTFSDWQRAITYQFSLTPLSAKGSILSLAGGRFNMGNIDSMRFPSFSALYLAQDLETAYREKYGVLSKSKENGFTSEELSLVSQGSSSNVRLKGKISQVLNLTNSNALKEFVQLLKNIKPSKALIKQARALNIVEKVALPMKSANDFISTFLMSDWRLFPMQFDVPSNSQIFGQIAHEAEIEAILYPSTKKSDKLCLAVFPKNFDMSDSYIKMQDKAPKGVISQLDATTFKNLL